MADLSSTVADLWERRAEIEAGDPDATAAVHEAINLLDTGQARVAEVDEATGEVVVHQWLKQAILLLFRLSSMETIEVGPFEFADRLPLKRDYAAAG
ncbi:MAG: 2,3,4,5-tetrahydropyridine-2,6-dicarboxylate N-succinyltransferase, partial [Actinomycetota bacterium]|nr:2,3,4,5-tetrahydropyridine-2,6-dicarboxylate N-succinyltransferase [Actinomycetota bacterium]